MKRYTKDGEFNSRTNTRKVLVFYIRSAIDLRREAKECGDRSEIGANKQRTKIFLRSFRFGGSADNEFLFLVQLDLDPCSAALTGLILGTAAFADQTSRPICRVRARSSGMSFVKETEYLITPGGFFSSSSSFAFRCSIGKFRRS